ncbi:hypothetical protein Pmar_PMAR001415, partial [Perkinsus marinus ATCC 50983]
PARLYMRKDDSDNLPVIATVNLSALPLN